MRRIIYIPIWLDLLFDKIKNISNNIIYLHSNMVRFIILYLKYDEMNKM